MATAKQIEANRLNALRSTGPKTEEGKAASRLNAVSHGLAAVLPEAMAASDDDRDEFDAIKKKWRSELRPAGQTQDWLFEMVVVESVRVERCQQTFFALCRQHGRRARDRWDDDRRQDAEALATGLAKNPALVAHKLASTPQGCDFMLDRWTGLRASLDRHQTWTDNQRSQALDLLGIHPDLRDAETPIDRGEADEFAVRCAVVESEIERITEVRANTLGYDATERALAEKTLGAEFTKAGQLLDRYERNALRRQQWAWRKLDAAKRGETATADPVKPPSPAAVVVPTPQVKPVVCPPRTIKMSEAEYAECAVEEDIAPMRSAETAHRASRPTGLNRRQRRKLAALDRRA